MKKNLLLIITITILFLGFSVTSSVAIDTINRISESISDGNILYVGGLGYGNYTTTQDAIDDAFNGDIVFVYDDSSPYNENVIIDKSINVIGEDCKTTIINGVDVYKSTIQIINDWVNISGFTVRNGYGGIRINTNNNTITGNILIENDWGGISLQNAKFNNITSNKITDNFFGIQLYNKSCNNIFSRNSITKSFHCGIVIGNPIVPTFLYETTDHNPYNSHNNKFIENNLMNYGIKNAFFLDNWKNTWTRNYWNRPRVFPKIIRGYIGNYTFPWWNIDWDPALLPYDIGL
jgi:parallel beta-helix repeat protein